MPASTRSAGRRNAEVRLFLGVTPGNGKVLGLDEAWAYDIVKQVGNYGESFERNLGMGSLAQAVARHQRPVDQGRPDVSAPAALSATMARAGFPFARPPYSL